MADAEDNASKPLISIDTLNYNFLEVLVEAKQNIDKADKLLSELDKDGSFISLRHGQLYYKTIQEGEGKTLDTQTDVLVHYTIKTPKDEVLADTWQAGIPVSLNLADTISGYTWGMKGMKEKEIREIYIHPALAYGLYTSLDKGIYLKATVQLVEIGDASRPFPELIQHDLTKALNPSIEHEYIENSKVVGYQAGYRLWQHYKKEPSYRFQDVKVAIDSMRSGKNVDISSESTQKLINRLHWNVYHKF